MARLKQFDIGDSHPVVLEKWQQMKNAAGSLTDVLVTRYSVYASMDSLSNTRVFENGQLKMASTFDMIVRKKNLDARDVGVQWKVVFQGRRHTVVNKVCLNKAHSDFLLTVESKGDTRVVATGAAPAPVGGNKVYSDYWQTTAGQTSVSGESVEHGYSLTGKTIIEVSREGLQYDLITSGTPGERQCIYSSGAITFRDAFNPGETVFVEFKI